MTPRPQMIRMNISSSQSKSRYETYLVDISPRSSPQLVADSWWLVAKSSLSKGSISLQPRGSRSERRSFLRDIHLETGGALFPRTLSRPGLRHARRTGRAPRLQTGHRPRVPDCGEG